MSPGCSLSFAYPDQFRHVQAEFEPIQIVTMAFPASQKNMRIPVTRIPCKLGGLGLSYDTDEFKLQALGIPTNIGIPWDQRTFNAGTVEPRRPEQASPIKHTITYPKALRTDNIRLLGPKTLLYKAFGLF